MTAALRKEMRLLLPAQVAAMAAATLPMWFARFTNSFTASSPPFVIFAAGVLAVSLASFGLEMSMGTFPSLLAQPRPRFAIWQTKIALLTVTLGILLVAAILVEQIQPLWTSPWIVSDRGTLSRPVSILVLLTVTAFASGLWTTILFRQIVAAFWFAVLIPLALYSICELITDWLKVDDNPSIVLTVFSVAVSAYAAAGYCIARWLFLRAEDKPAQEAKVAGASLFLPALSLPRWPASALLVKELRLQQGTLLICVVLLLLNLVAVAISVHFPAVVRKYVPRDFLMLWMLWTLMPFVVGCASIAEERRGRTLETSFSLPVRRLHQFGTKLLVTFGLGLFLGAVMPWCLDKLANPSNWLELPPLLLAAAVITALSCYASSLSASFLQAFGVAVGLFLATLSVVATVSYLFSERLRAFIIIALGPWVDLGFLLWPLSFAVCFILAYSNFKQLRITWRQGVRNVVLLLEVWVAARVIVYAILLILSWTGYPDRGYWILFSS